MSQYTAILFDLDGTIIDSAAAITTCLAKALADMGKPAESPEQLMQHVGPPLETGFLQISKMTPAEADQATKLYRKYYNVQGGYRDSRVFPGIVDVLQHLAQPLGVSTSKEEQLALTVAEKYELQRYFSVIRGSSLDTSRRTKALVVQAALHDLHASGVDTSNAVLVGDRHHDVAGAHASGIECIGVAWGYAEPGELDDAEAIASTPAQLQQLLA